MKACWVNGLMGMLPLISKSDNKLCGVAISQQQNCPRPGDCWMLRQIKYSVRGRKTSRARIPRQSEESRQT